MTKKNLMIILKCIIFISIVIVIFAYLTNVFRPKTSYRLNIGGFKNLENNSVDVIGLGSSHMYCTINPLVIWEQSHINSYIYATQRQSMEMSYFYLLEALKTQTPKVVILETYMIGKEQAYSLEAVMRTAIQNLPFSSNKLKMIYEVVDGNKKEYYFDFIKYHSRWKELKKSEFDVKVEEVSPFRGYHFYATNVPIIIDLSKKTEETSKIIGEDLEYLNKIYNLTKERGIELILLYSLYEVEENTFKDINAINEFTIENDIKFINCFEILDELEINSDEDFYDKGHLNYKGSEKVSKYIANVLKTEYNISTNYSVQTIESLNNDLQYYYNKIQK